MSAAPRFIHLRTHTEHSLLEGAVPVKKLVKLAPRRDARRRRDRHQQHVLRAGVFQSMPRDAGLQPIVGCQISLAYDPGSPGERPRPPAPIVLLAQDEAGYMNLMKLNSLPLSRQGRAVAAGDAGRSGAHAEGLICLTGGPDGPVGGSFRPGSAQGPRRCWPKGWRRSIPGRLYVELQRHPGEGGRLPEAERRRPSAAVEMAYDMGLPLVATNDVYFPKADMYEAHDALICIAEGAYVDQQEPRRRLTPQHYFKSEAEMAALFADLPEALENTVEIARRCAFGRQAQADPAEIRR
jgi:DNA polymerase-3 subunit alpha